MKARIALAALFAAGFGTAAAGIAAGDAGTTPESTPRGTVTVQYDGSGIDAGSAAVPAGSVTFEESHADDEEHDLLVVRTSTPPGELPVGLEGVSPESAGRIVLGEAHSNSEHGHSTAAYSDGHTGGSDGASGHERHLHRGEQRRRVVRLEPGRYVLICPVPGHYERGERTALTVG